MSCPENRDDLRGRLCAIWQGPKSSALNMGDCYAYACAKAHGAKLLFKGDDFIKTDITPAG